jgi:hypothetical protein
MAEPVKEIERGADESREGAIELGALGNEVD